MVKNGGSYDGAILHLFTDGTSIYGNGFTYGRTGGNLEGVFKADADHRRDHVGRGLPRRHLPGHAPMNGSSTSASHAHFCGNVGWLPPVRRPEPAVGEYQRHARVFKDEAAGHAPPRQLELPQPRGLPAPSPTTWAPEWTPGTFTGQGQATWAVEGNGQYVAYAGEFTR